ncbi:hydroxymethylglutaryl-CoA lyase [Sporormia fimetaria CBS 119925]|uniref:hydroxymethylglutaryl-CoA lyase n=1 Tax=Sporormia fimetaria CBS 119925 TaxID=1340428 RepID=A0A6A6VF78_9PLEO|nr:hydroxymethylglutaryl-CoA lyase [Sporormia fimetaria CBS 119925]
MSSKFTCLRTLRLAARHAPRRTFATTSARRSPSDDHVRIVEVGPRDGLQNEKQSIPVATKLELVRRLAETGLKTIEAGSFVSPKWVPQMASSDEILSQILKSPPASSSPITYQFLVPNEKGLDSFLSVYNNHTTSSTSSTTTPKIELSIFTAATESFTRKNTNCSIAESLDRFKPIMTRAKDASIPVRAYISVALGCPYEGPNVDPHQTASLAVSLLEMGADEISVADTTGMGTAPKTAELLKTLFAAGIEKKDLALHFHDTYGMALVNTVVALEHGIRTFDSAVGGLGGCPFSPGATGNVATEDLVHLVSSLGAKTDVDMEKLSEVGEWISGQLGRANESRAGKATLAGLRRGSKEKAKL